MADLANSVVLASSAIGGILATRLSAQERQTMCSLITAGINNSFFAGGHESLLRYFTLALPTHLKVGEVRHATRLLLGCRDFMGHANTEDRRIRPTLVAASMLHAPAKDAYVFINAVFPDAASVRGVRYCSFRVPLRDEA